MRWDQGMNLLGHYMFHSEYDLHSLFLRPASAVGLFSLKPSAHASAKPVRSQGKQLPCFSSPSFVLTQSCGSCSPLCRTGCAVALQLRAPTPVLLKEAISKGCCPVMCPSICPVVVVLQGRICAMTDVSWAAVLWYCSGCWNPCQEIMAGIPKLLVMAWSRPHILA